MTKKGNNFSIGNIKVGKDFFFIAGPCVIESEEGTIELCKKLKKIFKSFDMKFIFKASFDKANRTSISSFRGPGLKRGLEILKRVKEECDVLITTDIHTPEQAEPVAEVVDLIQIPAFLSRQTDIIVSASMTGKPVNIKKGQFMSPNEAIKAVEKASSTGNTRVFITERGTFFGYNDLVVDFRNIIRISKEEIPVILDTTHILQRPGIGETSGGDKEFFHALALAGIVCGVIGLFAEVHECPEKALSDPGTSVDLKSLKNLLKDVKLLIHTFKGKR